MNKEIHQITFLLANFLNVQKRNYCNAIDVIINYNYKNLLQLFNCQQWFLNTKWYQNQ